MHLTRRGRVVAAAGTALAVVAGVVALVVTRGPAPVLVERCRAATAERAVWLDPDQMANAATIAGIAVRRGLPPHAATIALATAMQESKLRNLEFGDRDSLGLFQQRPSQGWGTVQQVRDPVHATNAFYDRLVKVRGYRTLEVTSAAQRVQRSGYPEAYAVHEADARALASVLTGQSPAGVTCQLRAARADAGGKVEDEPAAARQKALKAVQEALARESAGAVVQTVDASRGLRLVPRPSDPKRSWALASWSVASAQRFGISRVYADGRVWRRSRPDAGWQPVAKGDPGVPAGSSEVLVLRQDVNPTALP